MKRRKKGERRSQPIRELGISENRQGTISSVGTAVTAWQYMVVCVSEELGGYAHTGVK